MIINVLMVFLTLTLKLKVKEFTSNISPTSSLASTPSRAVPEVVSTVGTKENKNSGKEKDRYGIDLAGMQMTRWVKVLSKYKPTETEIWGPSQELEFSDCPRMCAHQGNCHSD